MMLRRSPRARERRRGTASLEVLMMLSFYILIYAGIYYMHGRYAGRQLALTKARACAWAYAAQGCGNVRPDECELIPGGEGNRDAAHNAAGGEGRNILETISDLPVIGDLVNLPIDMLFGRPLTTFAYQDVHLPEPSMGPTDFRVGGAARDADGNRRPHYYTLCNTVRQTWGGVAHDVFCRFVTRVTDSFPTCP